MCTHPHSFPTAPGKTSRGGGGGDTHRAACERRLPHAHAHARTHTHRCTHTRQTRHELPSCRPAAPAVRTAARLRSSVTCVRDAMSAELRLACVPACARGSCDRAVPPAPAACILVRAQWLAPLATCTSRSWGALFLHRMTPHETNQKHAFVSSRVCLRERMVHGVLREGCDARHVVCLWISS